MSFAWFYRAVVQFVHVAVAFDCVPSSDTLNKMTEKWKLFWHFFLSQLETIVLYFQIFIFIMADNNYFKGVLDFDFTFFLTLVSV